MSEIIKEEWKLIVGYEDLYLVNNFGSIKCTDFMLTKRIGINKHRSIFISKIISNFGYEHIWLCKDTIRKDTFVHRLVADHFIPNPDNLPYINHIDKNSLNNYVENLEWVTARENCCHRSATIKKSSKYTGVSYSKQYNKWKAAIYYKGKDIFLGKYTTEKAAHNARVEFEKNNNINNKYL